MFCIIESCYRSPIKATSLNGSNSNDTFFKYFKELMAVCGWEAGDRLNIPPVLVGEQGDLVSLVLGCALDCKPFVNSQPKAHGLSFSAVVWLL